jgi:eukaryotic-like serine/threonine-protein kinase
VDIRPGSQLEGPDGLAVTIESLIGRGGFGQVFLGRLPDGTGVAIKTVLTATLDDSELRSLQNEAAHAIGIEHDNVVQVLHVDPGTSTGLPPYLVMEFVEGGNLRALMAAHKQVGSRFGVDELRAIYKQIGRGMAAVNAKVVHRDLKPENVLVDAASGTLKIADFGLAKLADAVTRSESFKGWGTRPYQAPEAFEHGPNTIAMDMYSAGVMFFELATLEWPLQPKSGDNSPLAWRNAHLLSPPKDIRQSRSDLPVDLQQMIILMLQKDPARRPASWSDVLDRLDKGAHQAPGRPDVLNLVQRATATLAAITAQEIAERANRERRDERRALLEQAFREPMDMLANLVEAFNEASDAGMLTLKEISPLSLGVAAPSRGKRLTLRAAIIDDLAVRPDGVYRVLGMARVEPTPTPASQEEAFRDRDSFGSFNLAYKVPKDADRFGGWITLRFEQNPLTGKSTYPRWFAVDLNELPRQLQVLRAMGVFQHQQRDLDDVWFKELLMHLV